MIKVLFVCLGNICRSPMAHMMFLQLIKEKGLSHLFEVESAGTEEYNSIYKAGIHYGTKEIFHQMKVPYEEHISRHFKKTDYKHYDYILTMDSQNVRDILAITNGDPDEKVKRLLDYTPSPRDVKDPWYTGNFDETYWDVYEGLHCFFDSLHIKKGDE